MLLGLLLVIVAPAAAQAYWHSSGAGTGSATTGTLLPPRQVTVPATSSGDVLVQWTVPAGALAPEGYYVTRTQGSTTSAACGSSAALLIDATSCNDTAPGDGTYRYTVTASYRSWTATDAVSGSVVVAAARGLFFATAPSDSVRDAAISPAVRVGLQTLSGEPVPSSGVSITISIGTNPSQGVLSGTVTGITDTTGTATFLGLSINAAGTGYTLLASSASLTSATSPPFAVSAPAALAPALGAAAGYSVLGSALTNTGATSIGGDIGAYPTPYVTGFPPGTVQGSTHAGDTGAFDAEGALVVAYADAAGRTAGGTFAGDLIGRTFLAGVHRTGAALELSADGVLTLDAQGDPNALFVFQIDGALDTAAGSRVVLINGARADRVFWQVNGAAGTGANSQFSGTILAKGAITLGAGGTLTGRALATGAVTLANNTIGWGTP
jgi:hypothetical protein